MRQMNKRGSIEGLPLYMTMMVVISAASVAILSGWFSGAEYRTIGDVQVIPGEIMLKKGYYGYSNEHIRLTVRVVDDKGNPIKGAAITITGMGITEGKGEATPHGITNSKGICAFYNLEIMHAYGPGEVTVKVTYGNGGIRYVTVPVGVSE